MAANKELGIAEKICIEADIDDVPVSIHAFVTNILAEELWLATRLPDPRIGRLNQGQGVHLTFDRDGPVVLPSCFLRRLGDNNRFDMQKSRVFAVQRPLGMENGQRRAHVRVDVERKIGIRSLGATSGQKMGTGRTVNIGAGGVLFTTAMPLLFGEELKIAIALTPRDIVIAGGSIVRIEDDVQASDPGNPEGAPVVTSRVAVRFDDISEADQEKITLHILKASRQAGGRAAAETPAAEYGGAADADAADAVAADAEAGHARAATEGDTAATQVEAAAAVETPAAG